MTSFSVQSFGCRVNQAEAFSWVEELQKNGLRYVEDSGRSDLVIVNTCTLTSRADRDALALIRRLARTNPSSRLILTGCYAQRKPGFLARNPNVWRVFSNAEKEEMVSAIVSVFGKNDRSPPAFYRSRALVKIQDGCDLACRFCVIPQVRGKSTSRNKEDIQTHIRRFVEEGFQEIVLTGVHLCLYGRDLTPESSLLELLLSLEDIKGLGRIRLSSLDPCFVDEPLLDHIASSPRICPHFHLSLQHGSDRVLRKMGRNIKTERYSSVMTHFLRERPDAAMGADVIVGFPEETEEDFQRAYTFLERSPLAYFHVFSYSPRPGTPAAEKPQVDAKTKKQRSSCLRALSRRKRLAFQQTFIGREMEAVVIEKDSGRMRVLTGNYLDVDVPGDGDERERVDIRITGAAGDKLRGEVVQRP